MRRSRKIVLWTLLILLPLGISAGFLATEKGLQWAYRSLIAERIKPLELTGVRGHLWGPIRIDDLRYKDPDLEVDAHGITLEVQLLSLLYGELNIASFNTESAKITITGKDKKSDAGQIAFSAPQLPIDIRLRSGTVRNITLSSGEGPATRIDKIFLAAKTRGQTLQIRSLTASARDFDLHIQGKLELVESLPVNLDAQWKLRLRDKEHIGTGSLKGNRKLLQVRLHHEQPFPAQADLTLHDWLDTLHWEAQLQGSALDPGLMADLDLAAIGSIDTLQANATGDRQQASGQLEISATHPELGKYTTRTDFAATGQQLTWKQLEVTASEMHLQSQGLLSWDSGLYLDATGTWQNLAYPFTPPARVNSPAGSFLIRGPVHKLEWSGTFTTSTPNQPDALVSLQGEYNRDTASIRLQQSSIKALDGEAIFSGKLDLAKSMSWELTFAASHLNPEQQWPDWKGDVNFTGAARGTLANGQVQVDIDTINGQLHQKTITGNASLHWSRDGLQQSRIQLRSGSAFVTAKGGLAQHLDFDWKIQAPKLQDLLPQARGSFSASGKISGSPAQPDWQISARANKLHIGELAIGELSMNLDLPATTTKGVLALNAHQVSWYGQNWQSVTADGSGSLQHHPLHLHAAGEDRSLDVRLTGAWLDQAWNANVQSLAWKQPDIGTWSLSDPATLNAGPAGLRMSATCLSGTSGKLCFDFAFTGVDTNEGHIRVDKVPLNIIASWLPVHIEADGEIQGKVDWVIRERHWQRLQGNLKLSPGKITLPTIQGQTASLFWPHEGGTLDANLRNDTLLVAWNILQSSRNTISGEIHAPAQDILNAAYTSPIQGTLHASIDDLRIFEVFMPQLYKLQGHGFADLKVSGTLLHPRITGQLGLRQTQFEWPRLGLQIQDLDLNIKPRSQDTYAIVVSARSDTGNLHGDGELSWPAWNEYRGEIHVKGEEFLAARLPEAELWVSPDLVVTITPGLVQMNGKMQIPRAQIHPKEISQSVSASDDVVIVGREESATEKRWKFDSRIQLSLGKDIAFDGFGLKGKIRGNLDITDRPDTLTLAQGELRIEDGTYKAYGQDLKIESGKLVFINSEITNPGLDIQATRKVNDITAGVRVIGTAENPVLQLYSQPSMSQADILSYLTLGRPMQQLNATESANLANTAATSAGLAGGEFLASWISQQMGISDKLEVSTETYEQKPWVRVGAYLSPRLYISYGVNLFENGSSLKVRYLLTPKWTLQGESGTQTGGDILYTIER